MSLTCAGWLALTITCFDVPAKDAKAVFTSSACVVSISPAIIERLNRDINAVLIDPELKAKLVQQAIELEGSTPQALAAFVDGEIAKWATVIKVSNIQRE